MVDVISFMVDNYQIFLILPIITAFKAEEHYVGRVSILSNTVGMFAAIAPNWDTTWYWLNVRGFPLFHAYLLIGLVFGLISFLSYLFGVRQESEFYVVTWLFYNSVIAGFVCLLAAMPLPIANAALTHLFFGSFEPT